jgi:hypothetical protein
LVAFILYGYEQGVFGPIILNDNWLDQFNHPSDSQTGIIVSCYNLGCLLGCFGGLPVRATYQSRAYCR